MNKPGIFIIFVLALATSFAFLLAQNDDGRLAAGNGCGSCESVTRENPVTSVEPEPNITAKQPALTETISPEYIDFNLPDLLGTFHTLSALNDRGILVLKFGATWCPPCNSITPELGKLEEKYKEKIRVVTIYIQEEVDHVAKHTQRHNDKLLALIDKDGSITNQYKISSIPAVYVFKRKLLLAKFNGYRSFDEMAVLIDKGIN